jgi:hypothetical protein
MHFQNGVEHQIRDLSDRARTSLLHAKRDGAVLYQSTSGHMWNCTHQIEGPLEKDTNPSWPGGDTGRVDMTKELPMEDGQAIFPAPMPLMRIKFCSLKALKEGKKFLKELKHPWEIYRKWHQKGMVYWSI